MITEEMRREARERRTARDNALASEKAHKAELAGLEDRAVLAGQHFDELFRRFGPDLQAVLCLRFDLETGMEAFKRAWIRIRRTGGRCVKGDNVRAGLFSVAFCAAIDVQQELVR